MSSPTPALSAARPKRMTASHVPPLEHRFPERTTVAEACFYHGFLRAAQLEMEIAHTAIASSLLFPGCTVQMRSCRSLQDCRGTNEGRRRFDADTPLLEVARHAAHVS